MAVVELPCEAGEGVVVFASSDVVEVDVTLCGNDVIARFEELLAPRVLVDVLARDGRTRGFPLIITS